MRIELFLLYCTRWGGGGGGWGGGGLEGSEGEAVRAKEEGERESLLYVLYLACTKSTVDEAGTNGEPRPSPLTVVAKSRRVTTQGKARPHRCRHKSSTPANHLGLTS